MLKLRYSALAAALALGLALAAPAAAGPDGAFGKAKELYDNGMYAGARVLFEQMPGDDLCADYAVLCAVKLKTQDCGRLVENVDGAHPKTMLNSEIHCEYGKLLYSEGNYTRAAEEFEKVSPKSLPRRARGEYWFKKGFCHFNREEHDVAERCYLKALDNPSEYDIAAGFGIGSIYYGRKDFKTAASWFERSAEDEQFGELSRFYLVDCHFMLKDYRYVVEVGEALFGNVPQERQGHLSRLLSEAYLVLGDAAKAREYLGREDLNASTATDEDVFHAASVLYAGEDWSGAVKYFSMMKNRSDSLGQIASYQMGNSYIQLKNKVAAMNAFKEASVLRYDDAIREDAYFNYAKLAFDLNGDDSAFLDYLRKYSTTRKGEMIYSYLAMSALSKRDYSAAVDAYDRIEELDAGQYSNYMKANFLRAHQLLASGSYSSAVRYLKAASYYAAQLGSKSDPLYQLARYQLADTYFRIESWTDARKTYMELYNLSALQNRPEGRLIPYNIAYCYFKAGAYTDAAKWFDTYIKSGDKLAREDALTRRADCDFIRRDYRSAAASYRKLLDEYPDSGNIYPYYHLGVAYALTGEKQRRVQALAMVMDAQPGSPYYDEAMYELGRALADVRQYDEALTVFDKLRNTSSNAIFRTRAMLGEGMVYRNAGNMQDALAAYKTVVSEMPGSEFASDALLSIQSIYTSLKTPEKYLEYVEANNISTGSTADTRRLYYTTAEQVYLAGNWSGAVSSFGEYLKRYPSGEHTADAYYYLAASYKQLGQKEKACELYRRALDEGLGGSSAEFAQMSYASLTFEMERYADAYGAYQQICSSASASARGLDPYLGVLRSAYRGRMWEETLAAAEQILRRTTEEAYVREANYDMAKAYMSTSRRDEAMKLFVLLAEAPATAEGAEATVALIQDLFDRGRFEDVENKVYDFSSACGNQSYWLARSYIILADSFAERGMLEQAVMTLQSIRDGYVPYGEQDDILETVERKLQSL